MNADAWRARWSPYEHPNNTSAHIAFENGTRCHYLHTHDAARTSLDIQLHGSRGALCFDGTSLTFNERPLEQFGTRGINPVSVPRADDLTDLLRDFHAYITQGIEPGVSVRNNLETMAACEMMVRSIQQRRPVRRSELDA
jgi:predicted dehydrogenase